MFGEMGESLNIRMSTNSYMLSNKSKDRRSARQAGPETAPIIRVLTDPFVLQRSVVIGITTSCTCPKISRLGSTDLRMRRRINLDANAQYKTAYRANHLRHTHRAVYLVFIRVRQRINIHTIHPSLARVR